MKATEDDGCDSHVALDQGTDGDKNLEVGAVSLSAAKSIATKLFETKEPGLDDIIR